ncbi:N-acetylmuramoyl-L-alanine amidase [Halalkalibacter kiskunsagensis]|uniref:N-acetylmuramoyl-L-alanine amidase n=1 Tax=Halalkalibacter kiskunsagensis TaxID=1548599 RepID=A0ABV6KEZ1_9BACI
MTRIFIDSGHGGHDSGAIGHGLMEKNVVLDIAKRIETKLKGYEGVVVKLSRTNDTFLSLTQRANLANAWKADYFVSIHINAFNRTANGYEDFIYNGNVSKATVSNQNIMNAEIIKATGFNNRGRKSANFGVLRQTNMPAILTENGFIDNASDATKLKSSSFLDKVAEGHVQGLVKIFGLKKKAQPSPTPAKSNTDKLYRVQVGAFSDKQNAEALAKELEGKGYSVFIAE